MNLSMRRRTFVGAAVAAAATPLALAQAGPYPNRPIRLFVGYAAGGAVDTMARIVAQRLTTVLGQSVVVENRAGSAGLLAADTVAKSPADGYTLLHGESALLIAPQLQNQTSSLDPIKALVPVAGLFQSRLLLVANNAVAASNPAEFLALVKANPGRFTYGTSGIGTVHHLGVELFKSRTRTHLLHIPYRGASQLVTDVINGQLQFGVVSAAAGVPQVRSGRVKAVAMFSSTRLAGAEDIGTLSEVVPGFHVAPRQMLLAPAGTPQAVIDRLSAAVGEVLATPEAASAAAAQGVTTAYLAPGPLAADVKREYAEWGKVIKAQGISAE
ncbi:MAG: tripartite tricarboxylate transporter substrate binding protein [Hydrogenophaga sp.]|jgi:tripartite-type tricarboxylate transporter receptor subunit TctC|uniref:Bug family tripartite tricarboxylate transporter substrate binding protein n=1 Tax=Hydrogenophaga sp. TaxID=1904254 RepID=UPI002614A1B4|nr:tripartite tricarboxylate transporter substrate-binding protein [Hydrogenophaga sp.]MCW5668795.1 tripartite tricarboxylate transporter substrate binding protein [Hydrogenophaga sp.]